MFDLTLLRKPAFAGASIAAFALSASLFSMFLYMTLYIQNALGYSPLQAGLRFLPVTLLSFFVAPIAGKLSTRLPVRLMIGVGLGLVGVGLLLMARPRRRLGMDRAAARLPVRRRGRRADQPAARLDRRGRRAAAARRDGVGHQLDLPPDRDRDRHRRPRRAVPAVAREQGDRLRSRASRRTCSRPGSRASRGPRRRRSTPTCRRSRARSTTCSSWARSSRSRGACSRRC